MRAVGCELPQHVIDRRIGSKFLREPRQSIRSAAFAEAARNPHDDVRKCSQSVHRHDGNKTGTKDQAPSHDQPRQVATYHE